MFESSVIVEMSPSVVLGVKRWISKSLLERVQIHKNAGKPKTLWELKDFSEEQQTV